MWAVVKFSCLRGKTTTKMFEKMKSIYSDDCLSWTQVFALHEEFLKGRETVQLRNAQHNGRPPTLFTKINVNTVRTLMKIVLKLLRNGGHNRWLKVDDRKHYEKTWYAACRFDVSSASFNKTATSTLRWCLHTFEKQTSRWRIVHVPYRNIWWNMGPSSQP